MEEKEETGQLSKAKKGVRHRKNTARKRAEKRVEAFVRQRRSEQRTCAVGGGREPVSTRKRKRLRIQLI